MPPRFGNPRSRARRQVLQLRQQSHTDKASRVARRLQAILLSLAGHTPHRPSADWFAGPLHTAAFRSNGEILRGAQGNFSRQLAKEFGARELKVLSSFLCPKFFSRLLREFVCAPTFAFISPHRCH